MLIHDENHAGHVERTNDRDYEIEERYASRRGLAVRLERGDMGKGTGLTDGNA